MDLRPFYNRFSHLSHSFSLFPRLTSVERVECGVRGEEEKAERATNSGVRLDEYDTVWVYYSILHDSGYLCARGRYVFDRYVLSMYVVMCVYSIVSLMVHCAAVKHVMYV